MGDVGGRIAILVVTISLELYCNVHYEWLSVSGRSLGTDAMYRTVRDWIGDIDQPSKLFFSIFSELFKHSISAKYRVHF